MNIDDKRKLFLDSYTYFYGSDHVMCSKIYGLLNSTEDMFDIELCFFYKDNVLEKRYKCVIDTSSSYLLFWIADIVGVPYSYSQNWKQITIVFDEASQRIEVWMTYVYIMKNISFDIAKKFKFSGENYVIETRKYKHMFPEWYRKNRIVGNFLNRFNIIDIILLDKLFFWKMQKTIYFLLETAKYNFKEIENIFFITCPSFIKKYKIFVFCICIIESEHKIKNYNNFSVYFGSYSSH